MGTLVNNQKALYVLWGSEVLTRIYKILCLSRDYAKPLYETFVMVIWKVKFHPYLTEYFVFISIEQCQ